MNEDMAITINQVRPVTDEELMELSRRNPGYQIERRRDRSLIVTPTSGKSGYRSGEVFRQLAQWNREHAAGVTFDSSTGFHLADGSVLSPDASWVRRERWEALSLTDQETFPPLCPNAVFEVRSKSNTLGELRQKMRMYIDNGAELAILIDPYERFVEVWRPSDEPERRADNEIALEAYLPGFVLETMPIYD
jgi:Uma2 family endonuclease